MRRDPAENALAGAWSLTMSGGKSAASQLAWTIAKFSRAALVALADRL
jgi:hypothetical protein